MKINTYGYKMNGIRKAACETKGLAGYYGRQCVQISYNRVTGEVLSKCNLQNSWFDYNDSDVIAVCSAYEPMTVQQIADAVEKALATAKN